MSMPPEVPVTAMLRRLLLAIIALGMVGVLTELVLLEHTESFTQLIPLVLLAAGMLAVLAAAVRPRRPTLRLLQAVMVAFVITGVAGLILHYRGNVEFELEMYPTLRGAELFYNAITGATPALAPGAMIQLGLLGLLYTWRHPTLSSR